MNSFTNLTIYVIIWKIVLADQEIAIPKICKAPLLIRALKITPYPPPYFNDDTEFIKYHIFDGGGILSFCPAKTKSEQQIANDLKRESQQNITAKKAPKQNVKHLRDSHNENITADEDNNKNANLSNQVENPSTTEQSDDIQSGAHSETDNTLNLKKYLEIITNSEFFSLGTLLFPRKNESKRQCGRTFKPSVEKKMQCEEGAYNYNVGYWVWNEANKMATFLTIYQICFSNEHGTLYTWHKIKSTRILQNSNDFDISKIAEKCKNEKEYESIEKTDKDSERKLFKSISLKNLSFKSKSKKSKKNGNDKSRITETSGLIANSEQDENNEILEENENILESRNQGNKGAKPREKVEQNDQKSENEKVETSLSYDEILVAPKYIEEIRKLETVGNSKYQLVPFDDMPIHTWQITTLFYFNVISISTEFKTLLENVDNFIRMTIVEEQMNVAVHTKLIVIGKCSILKKTLITKYIDDEKVEDQGIAIITQEPFAECAEICTDICTDNGWEEIKKIDNRNYTRCCEVEDEFRRKFGYGDLKLLKLKLKPPALLPLDTKSTSRSASFPFLKKISSFSLPKGISNRSKSFQ